VLKSGVSISKWAAFFYVYRPARGERGAPSAKSRSDQGIVRFSMKSFFVAEKSKNSTFHREAPIRSKPENPKTRAPDKTTSDNATSRAPLRRRDSAGA